jgi:hypothetical protein
MTVDSTAELALVLLAGLLAVALLVVPLRIGWLALRRRALRRRLRRGSRAAAVQAAYLWAVAWRAAAGAGLPPHASPDVVAASEAYEPDLRELARSAARAAYSPDQLPRTAPRDCWAAAEGVAARARAGATRRRRLSLLLGRGLQLPARES